MTGGRDATLSELEAVLGPAAVRPSSRCGDCGGALWRTATPGEADEMERSLGVRDDTAAAAFWACLVCGNLCMVRFDVPYLPLWP